MVEIEKVTRMNELFDVYGCLLTSKQKSYFELYYLEDLTLAEIASEFEVSRNAVFDNIKRTEKLLEDYEQKLKIVSKRFAKIERYEKLVSYCDSPEFLKILESLQSLD